jgi:hypothetical protein
MNSSRLNGRQPGTHGNVGWILFSLSFLTACGSSTEPVLTIWEGDLEPVPPATVGGLVAAVSQFGRTEASIRVTDAEPGETYLWRIDSGTCQEAGETQGGVAAYPPLTPGQSGTASTDAVLASVFRADRDFAARVFLAGGAGEDRVVACGPLRQTG